MGLPRGIGNEGVDPKGSGPKAAPNILTGPGGGDRSPRSLPQSITLQLRWESALPVRLAELKLHEIEPPTLHGDGYSITVYGVPGDRFQGHSRTILGQPLKNLAALKREGKKDVRPVWVECSSGKGARSSLSVSFVGRNQQERSTNPIRGADPPDRLGPRLLLN